MENGPFQSHCHYPAEVRQDMRGGTVQGIGMQLTSKLPVTKTLASDQAKLLSEFRRVYMIYSMSSILW